MSPPVQYLEPTPVPYYVDPRNGGLARYTQALNVALGKCNADKASVLEWSLELGTVVQTN